MQSTRHQSYWVNILTAIRDGENRVRFIGYNPVAFKVFIYCVSAGLAGLAGVFFVLQEGIISPAQMGIVPSIEMVLWVAIGGRATIGGAVLGALVTNAAKTTFSEAYPALVAYYARSHVHYCCTAAAQRYRRYDYTLYLQLEKTRAS